MKALFAIPDCLQMRNLRTPIVTTTTDDGIENPNYIECPAEAMMIDVDVDLEDNAFLENEEITNEGFRSQSPPTHDV